MVILLAAKKEGNPNTASIEGFEMQAQLSIYVGSSDTEVYKLFCWTGTEVEAPEIQKVSLLNLLFNHFAVFAFVAYFDGSYNNNLHFIPNLPLIFPQNSSELIILAIT